MNSPPVPADGLQDPEPGTHLELELGVLLSEIKGADHTTSEALSRLTTRVVWNLNGLEAQSSQIEVSALERRVTPSGAKSEIQSSLVFFF